MRLLLHEILILILVCIEDASAVTPCNGNTEAGENNPKIDDDGLDPETGVAIMMYQNEFRFQCCGFIYQWVFYADAGYTGGPFDLQVWRENTGMIFDLVGANTVTSTAPGDNEYRDIPVGQRTRVNDGDNIGIHATGSFPIRWGTVPSSDSQGRLKLSGITTAMGTPYDWTSSVNSLVHDYAVNAYVTQGATPSFSVLSNVVLFNDEVSVGQVVKSLVGTDADTEDIGSLTFTIQSSTNSGTSYFEVASGSSDVTIKAAPPVGDYTLTMKVEDPCTLSSTDNFKIMINNRAPVIHNMPSSVSIAEDTAAALIFTINATDTVTDPLPCSLASGDSTKFEVKLVAPSTSSYGVYSKSTASYNYDVQSSHSVTVRCDDGDDTVSKVLTVNLIRNEPPSIDNLPADTSFSEDLSTRTLLHTLTVTDAEGDAVTCSLNPTSSVFDVTLVPSTTSYGIYLTGGTTLDYDTKSMYVLSVKCSDHRRSVSKDYTVNLIRNTPPIITSLPASNNISEDLATRTLLHTLTITDVDVSDVHTCILASASSLFEVVEITPSSGQYGVFLSGGTTLDHDTIPSYVLSVTCSDHRRGDTKAFTVNLIRNEPPIIQNLPMSVEIHEDTSKETLLYTVSVTDPTNDAVTCAITTTTSIFFMQIGTDQYNNDVYVRSNIDFDYDVQKTYRLDIACADHRRSVSSSLFIYLIRNMPPKFTNLQGKTTIASLATTVGMSVFTITTEDPESDILKFTMSSSANHPFTINQNTGELSLTRSIKTEAVTGYDVSVYVNDGKNTVGPGILTVIVTGINRPPVLANLPLTIWILEGVTVGSTVFQVLVKDFDLADTHKFSVIYSPPGGAVYFNLNKTDGRLMTISPIDYETISNKEFTFDISVTDSYMEDNGTLTVNILNVNESPKYIKTGYSLSASEAIAGTVLQDPHYQYVDEDGDTVSFNFDCPDKNGRFYMNSANGRFSYAIDYDLDVSGTSSLVQCKVIVSDKEYSDSANVNITVLDTNDNSPRFQHSSYTFIVPLDSAIGTIVGQVLATDEDIGNYGKLLYHIEQGTIESGVFEVLANGEVRTKGLLTDYTEGTILNFNVYAVDTGGLENITEINIVIPDTLVVAKDTHDDTIMYFTFFSYARNMAWFVPSVCFASIAALAVIYTIRTSECDCKRSKRKKRHRKPRKRPNRDHIPGLNEK